MPLVYRYPEGDRTLLDNSLVLATSESNFAKVHSVDNLPIMVAGSAGGVAKTGGVIGIGYWDAAICSTAPAAIANAIAHVRDLVGIDHVGLGSDFDGAVTTGFDTAQLVAVTQALVDRGFSHDEIRKVMGGNVLRLLGQLP